MALLCLGAGPTEGDVALEYQAPPGCPGEATFRERAADLYGFRDPFVRAGRGAASTVRVAIEHSGKGYEATIRATGDGRGPRSSSPEGNESCDILVFVLAHRVAMVIARADPPAPAPPPRDPALDGVLRRLGRLEEVSESQDGQIKKLLRQNETLKRALEDEKRKMNLTYSVFTGVMMTANLTSDVGPGLWLGGDLRIDPISIGIELRAALPSRFVIGPYDRDVSQLTGLLTPCGRYFIFFGCAVAGAGVQIDADTDIELAPGESNIGSSPLVQLGGRVGVEVPLGESRFAIRGWGEVLYSTPSISFSYSDGTSVDRPDVSAFFGLGFVVKLGTQEGAK